MISLHDYSKFKENGEESLPTLLNNLNKIVEEELEIVYVKPQEITIFQVFEKKVQFCYFLHCLIHDSYSAYSPYYRK